MILGLLLMAAALLLTGYNLWDSNRAGKAAQEVALSLQEEMPKVLRPAAVRGLYDPATKVAEPQEVPDMAVREENGYAYIGNLNVPTLALSLPVMANWDYDSLQISPCVYSGSYYTDDLVICGHNYSSHFSSLRSIALGAEVYLTTVDGYVYHYIVDNVETVTPTEIERMITGDNWDLTFFTCHIGGRTRYAVRCVLADD